MSPRIFFVFAGLVLSIPLRGQMSSSPPLSIQALLDQGTVLLNKRSFDAANATFRQALEHASSAHDTTLQARALFNLGLSMEQRADVMPDTDERERLFDDAVSYYERVLALSVPPGSALNRIAYVRMRQGRDEEALTALNQALGLNGENRPYFAEKIGDYFAHVDDAQAAVACYREALNGPYAADVHRKVLALVIPSADHKRAITNDVISLLSDVYRAHDADATAQGALDALRFGNPDPAQVRALFALTAASLATKNYDSVALGQSGVTSKLIAIGARPGCEGCATAAETIRRLYSGEFPALDWWRVEEKYGAAVSPAAGMRALLRTLGNTALSQRDYSAAETLFSSAMMLSPDPDLHAAALLTSVYLAQQKTADIQQLDDVINRRYYQKNTPPPAGIDWDGAYEYERTVGSVDWSGGKWTSAASHLSLAGDALQHANADKKSKGLPIAPDPWLFAHLGQAYKSTNNTPEAAKAYIQSAESFASTGDTAAARTALQPVAFTDVPDDFVVRYSSLVGTDVTVQNPNKLTSHGSSADTLRGMLAIAATGTTTAERDRAMQYLRGKFGISDIKVVPGTHQGEASLANGDTLSFQFK